MTLTITTIACTAALGFCAGALVLLKYVQHERRYGRLITERDHENTLREVVKNLKTEERSWLVN